MNYFGRYVIIYLLVLFTSTAFSFAQLLTNNGITITNSGRITVNGDVLLEANGSFNNTDTIDLTGNWINNNPVNNGFTTNSGSVILNGINQTIGGVRPSLFNNLTFVNGIKTLDVNTSVCRTTGGVLNLTNAVFNLNTNSCTINNNPIGFPALDYTTGYILSESADFSGIMRWLVNFNAGTYTIPFGNAAGVGIPFSISPMVSAGILEVATYATAANNTPFPIFPTLVTHVRNAAGLDNSTSTVDRFWFVKTSFSTAYPVTLSYAPAENAAGGNVNARAQRWNATAQGWDAALPGQTNPTAQSVTATSSNYNSNIGNIWALALSSNPLPVELLFFTAKAKDKKKAVCNWSTASEINNHFFTVLRSKDGNTFEEIGIVNGNGTTNAQNDYSFIDNMPYEGISYYQLKQNDFNGDATFSQIENVLLTIDDIKFMVYPNPNSGTFTLKFNPEQNLTNLFSIVDARGRLIMKGKLDDSSGTQQVKIEKNLTGIYFLHINDGATEVIKISIIN